MKLRIGLVVLYIFALILVSMPVTAVFEVPEGAIIFKSLGLSETYDCNTSRCQTKEVTLQFAEPSETKIVLYTFRSEWMFNARIYVNGLLATANVIKSGNQETTMTIPGAFIETGENTIYLEFISYNEYYKFNKFPITIAPKSYILSTTSTPAQMDTPGFYIVNIQKSSETAPSINVEDIELVDTSNGTYYIEGTASDVDGIKSIKLNGNLVIGSNQFGAVTNIYGDFFTIEVADNSGNITQQKYQIDKSNISSTSEPIKSSSDTILGSTITALGTIIAALIAALIAGGYLLRKR